MALDERLPAFLRQRLESVFSPEDLERIGAGFGCERRTAFRVNPLSGDRETVLRELEAAGLRPEPLPWYEDGFTLPADAAEKLRLLSAYEEGRIYLQNPSSMLPPVLLGSCAGKDVLDMCAAPGGKTTQIFAMAGGKCGILACEQDRNRAKRLQFNLEKQKARANVQVCDARKLDSFFRFDRILLDAPCSGSGTVLTGRPATYKAFSELLVKNCAKLQLQLLKKALSLLKPGQEMVYSTCSILPEEDEAVVREALKLPGISVVPLPEVFSCLPQLPCSVPGALFVCPTETYEGFFAVKLRKT